MPARKCSIDQPLQKMSSCLREKCSDAPLDELPSVIVHELSGAVDSPFLACSLQLPAEGNAFLHKGETGQDSGVLEQIVERQSFPATLHLRSYQPLIEPLTVLDERWGHLIVAVNSKSEEAEKTAVIAWGFAESVRAALAERVLGDEVQRLQTCISEQQSLCVLADLVSPVAHELQNVLNSMLLQAAIAERSVPEESRKDLSKIRQLGVQAGDVMKHFNRYRYGKSVPRYRVDLNAMVETVLQRLRANGANVEWTLDDGVGPIEATTTDVRRMVDMMVEQAIACTSARNGRATVTCETGLLKDGQAVFRVTDHGGKIGPEELKRLFQFSGNNREGADSIELLACQALVRRLGGTLRVEGTEDGLTVSAELPVLGPPEH